MKLINVTALLAALGCSSSAFAFSIGHLNQGSQYLAGSNIGKYASDYGHSYAGIDNATFNGMSVATLAATYDAIVIPWYVNSDANLDWATRLLPYMQAGGSVMWEDPVNLDDLAGSGLTFGSAPSSSTISLIPPFDANGAASIFHIHFGIASISSAWDAFATDSNGAVHGAYGVFGAGRMVIAISDNLYHANFTSSDDADHYNLFINEMNWLDTGDVDIPAGTVPDQGASAGLLGLGLLALAYARRK